MGALASLYYGKGLQYLDLAMEEAALQIAEQRNTPGSVALDVRFINYGESLYVLGRNSEAEAAFRRALTIREQADGPNSLEVAINLSYLANAVSAQGKTEQAESLLRRSIAIQESYGAAAKKHDIARSLNNLGTLLGKNGAYQEAEICLGKAIKLCEEGTDPDHPHTLTCVNQLARLFLKKGEHASAEPLFRRALAARERVLGPIHPNTLASVNDLADLLEATGRYQEATAMRQGSLEVQERSLGPENPDTLRSWNQHTYALRKQGLAEQAEPIDRRVAATTAKILGDNHPLAIHRRNNLVLTLIMLGKLEEARQILAANWRLNAPPHANTTLRIAFLRQLIALLESQPDTPFLGQLKTLLTGPELPVVTDVAVPWDIAYFIGHLRSQLPPGSADFLTALVAALNERAKVAELEGFPEWRNQPPVQLDAPWPD